MHVTEDVIPVLGRKTEALRGDASCPRSPGRPMVGPNIVPLGSIELD